MYARSPLEVSKEAGLQSQDINVRSGKRFDTALHVAVCNRQFDLAKQLLEQGANPNIANGAGNTPLHVAAHGGISDAGFDAWSLCNLLIDRGANVNAINHDGNTPLHVCAQSCSYSDEFHIYNVDIAKALRAHQADLTIRNLDGKTPAQLARFGEGLQAVLSSPVQQKIDPSSRIEQLEKELQEFKLQCSSTLAAAPSNTGMFKPAVVRPEGMPATTPKHTPRIF